MTLELAAELADNATDTPRPYVDPRTLPTRFSLLKLMNECPAKYEHACQQDQDDSLASRLGAFASDRKEAFRIGNAIDQMLTAGSDELAKKRVRLYTGRRDPRVQAWKDFQKEAAADGAVEILIESEMATVRPVVDAIRRREDAMKLLFDGTFVQKRIDWEWMGKKVRSTPDAYSKTHIVDLKTSQSAKPEAFKRDSRKFFYHAQAELYSHALLDTQGISVPDHFLVVVEKQAPHPITIFRFTEEMLDIGAKMNRLWMERLQQCELANRWPVYAPEPAIVDIDVDEEWDA